MKNFLFVVTVGVLMSSCAAMFNGAVLPNQCKKCAIIDYNTGDTLQVFEGCGSENTRLEESAKEAAFDRIKSSGNCNIDVVCISWKKDPEE
ncbi:MAG: hypothetical protein H6600_05645 [Flavobacteriales bacterium]|nr:hypothetical protein [Flavobacteriales bacterium]